MARINKSDKKIRNVPSDLNVHEKGAFLGGTIYIGVIGRYFHRKNQRYTEVFAGQGKEYSFGMDESVLHYIHLNDVDYIFIETQFRIWEISTHCFIDNMKPHKGIKNLYVCQEEFFCVNAKKDTLDKEPLQKEFANSKKIRDQVKEQKERAKKNAENAKKESFGKQGTAPVKKKYKEGEQTTLF